MTDEVERTIMNECYTCAHRRTVAWDAHINCAEPDRNMTGDQHGIDNGWFIYPFLFDPVWKTKLCDNHTKEEK